MYKLILHATQPLLLNWLKVRRTSTKKLDLGDRTRIAVGAKSGRTVLEERCVTDMEVK